MLAIFNAIMALWHSGKKFIENHGSEAIDITNTIKAAVDSDSLDAVTTLIPGEWDNEALAWVREAAPIACDMVAIVIECDIDEGPIPYFQCVVDEIKKIDAKRRAGFYRDLASQLAIAKAKVSGEETKLSLCRVNLAIEAEYNRRFDNDEEE